MTSPNESAPGKECLLLTIVEVGAKLGIGRSSVYELIRKQQLETVKIGRCTRVPAVAVATFVERLRAAAISS